MLKKKKKINKILNYKKFLKKETLAEKNIMLKKKKKINWILNYDKSCSLCQLK